MRRILVTGGNKGIGLAIVQAILEQHDDTFVWLGSRDLERGRAAAAGLKGGDGRVEVIALDVASERSVVEAKARIADTLAGEKLYGLVNNAGIADAGGSFADVIEVNAIGLRRVSEAFFPLLDDKVGRVVNITSAAGPSFVAKCSAEHQAFFLDETLAWPRLAAFVDDCLTTAKIGDAKAFAAKGLSDGAVYGLSKAIANTYTLISAREHPNLRINACTPGFIETDLSRSFAQVQGKSPAELGMKTPAEGARAPMHLLFGDLEGNGRYYGSDAKRSPLDRYRAPGSPAYEGS